jgi:hypothetical protein
MRLYLVGNWLDQNTIVHVNGVQVFTYVLGFKDTYQDLEFTFDHTSPTIELTIQSSASTAAGARDGIKYGVSDLAIYVNPCQQKSYYDMDQGSCQQNTGYSTFYHLVQTSYLRFFPVEKRPVWTSVMEPVKGITSSAHEVYSFLKGSNLEVIIGTQGKPQFVDMDLIERLKKQIDAKHVASTDNTNALGFLSGKASQNIIGDYKNGNLTSEGLKYDNLIGASVTQAGVKQFKFAFDIVTGYACVGLIETTDFNSLSLSTSLRKQSLVVCSDDLTQPETRFNVQIDTTTNTISFKDEFYDQGKQLKFKNASNLYYTVQFYKQGSVLFGKDADAFQPKSNDNNEESTN